MTIPPNVPHSRRRTRLWAVASLACMCAIGLAPAACGKTENVDKLIDKLGDIRNSFSAEKELIGIGAPAVEPLIAALKDPDPHIRSRSAYILGEIKDLRAVRPLAAALQDPSPTVKNATERALHNIIDRPQAVDVLIGYLKDPDAQLREVAAFALGKIKDPRAVEPLLGALQDPEANIRARAAYALGAIRNPSAAQPLIATLNDADANVRQQSAEALGQIRDPRALDSLIAALTDSVAQVRGSAANALGAIGDPRALAPLSALAKDPDTSVQNIAASASHAIRLELPDGRFVPNHDGTVLDTKTGLMWAAKDNGADISWEMARAYCILFRAGGYRDWRMPYPDELAGLYDASKTQRMPGTAGDSQATVHIATETIQLTRVNAYAAIRPQPGLVGVIGVPVFSFNSGQANGMFACGNFCGRVLPVRSTVPAPASTSASPPSQ